MTIQSEIDRIKSNVVEAYQNVEDMGGTLPEQQNSDNLPNAISTIPALGSLSGTPGQVVGFNGEGKIVAVQGWSNPNLLLNWDFRNPVNRNGAQKYTNPGTSIDMWKINGPAIGAKNYLEILTDGIEIHSETSDVYFGQAVYEDITNKTILFTVLTSDGTKYTAGYNRNKSLITPFGIVYIEQRQPEFFTANLKINSGNSVTIVAAKVEFSTEQTLLYQNASGDWLVQDTSNYDLQYMLCSQYDLITRGWIGTQYSNVNLFDNPDFTINQVGFDSDEWKAGEGPDRWRSSGNGSLTYHGGSITFNNQRLCQRFEIGFLIPGVYTISALCTDNIYVQIGSCGNAAYDTSKTSINYSNGFASVTLNVQQFDLSKNGFVYVSVPTGSTISYLKMERGFVQTLAHKEGGVWVLNDLPNKANELLKCQACRLVMNTDRGIVGNGVFVQNNMARVTIPTPVTMRKTPTVFYKKLYIGTKGHVDDNAAPISNISDIRLNANSISLNISTEELDDVIGQAALVQIRGEDSYLIFNTDL